MSQLCAVDLAHANVLGEIPILAISWASPKVGNKCLAEWVDKMHPRLRVLRIKGSNDRITTMPPDWLWRLLTGGFKHMGTEIVLDNEHLQAEGVVKSNGKYNEDSIVSS